MINFFSCVCTVSLKREIYFLKFKGEIVWVLLLATAFMPFAFRKYINDRNIPGRIPVQGFCPLKTEIAQFPIRFRLKVHVLKRRPFESPITVMFVLKCGKVIYKKLELLTKD